MKAAMKTGKFMARHLFGLQLEPEADRDRNIEVEISASEAAAGGEKVITARQGNKKRKLAVKIPPGVKNGTRIRLRGAAGDGNNGDLYAHIRVVG